MIDTPPRRNVQPDAEKWARWAEKNIKYLLLKTDGSQSELRRLAKQQVAQGSAIQRGHRGGEETGEKLFEFVSAYDEWYDEFYGSDPTMAPSRPILSTKLGTVVAHWDGLMQDDSKPPTRLKHVIAEYALTEPPAADPAAGEPGYVPIADETEWLPVSQPLLTEGDTVITEVPVGDDVWVRFRSYNNMNVPSGASRWAHIVVKGIDTAALEEEIASELAAHDEHIKGLTDATPNPAPAAPALTTALGVIVATWDGLLGGEEPPLNFKSIVTEHRTSETAGAAAGPWLRESTPIITAGSAAISGVTVGASYDVRFIAVNSQGFESDAGPLASIVVEGINVEDLEGQIAEDLAAVEGIGDTVAGIQGDAAAAVSAAQDAQDTADQAAQEAANAVTTADGKNRIFSGTQDPSTYDPPVSLSPGDLWMFTSEDPDSPHDRMGAVGIWDGTAWRPNQIVASSLLVPSTVGTIQLADGAITAPKVQAESITGEKIAARTITASKLVLADNSNLVSDPNFQAPLGESWDTTSAGWDIRDFTGYDGRGIAVNAGSVDTTSSSATLSARFAVAPGDRLLARARLYVSGTFNGNHSLGISFYDSAGTYIGRKTTQPPNGTWEVASVNVVAPANAQTAKMRVAIAGATEGLVALVEPQVLRRASAELIVDGAITAGKIASKAVTADTIAANAVRAVNIESGAVTTNKLAAGAVTASRIDSNSISTSHLQADAVTTDKIEAGAVNTSKLTVGDFTNLVEDPNISHPDESWSNGSGTRVVSTTGGPGRAWLIEGVRGTYHTVYNRGVFTVREGDRFLVALRMANRMTKNIRYGIRWDNESGASLGKTTFRQVGNTGWTDTTVEAVAPAGAFTGRFVIQSTGGTGRAWLSKPRVHRMAAGELIVDGAISTEKLVARAVTADKIAVNNIRAGHIESGAIETNKLAAGAVTASKIKANSINASHIVADAVTASELRANSIYTGHLRSNAVTASKIAAKAINANHIEAGAIRTEQLTSNIITGKKFVGGYFRTTSSTRASRTILDSNGLRIFRGTTEVVRVGHGYSNGLAIRPPGSGLRELNTVIFGSVPNEAGTSWRLSSGGWKTFDFEHRFVASSNRATIWYYLQQGDRGSVQNWDIKAHVRLISGSQVIHFSPIEFVGLAQSMMFSTRNVTPGKNYLIQFRAARSLAPGGSSSQPCWIGQRGAIVLPA